MARDERLPRDEYAFVVERMPLVSVDLVVRRDDAVLLGKRTNQPAKGEWFVPGGTVLKNERLTEAVHRVAGEELGTDVSIDRRLGVYEHFWDEADVDVDGGKHYVTVGHVVTPEGDVRPDDQHAELRWFSPPFEGDLHHHVRQYLADAGITAD